MHLINLRKPYTSTTIVESPSASRGDLGEVDAEILLALPKLRAKDLVLPKPAISDQLNRYQVTTLKALREA